MQTVLVAIDNDMACSHVLSAAGALGAALEARLIAVHVGDDGDRLRGDIERVVERDALQAGVRLREFDGDVVDTRRLGAGGRGGGNGQPPRYARSAPHRAHCRTVDYTPTDPGVVRSSRCEAIASASACFGPDRR